MVIKNKRTRKYCPQCRKNTSWMITRIPHMASVELSLLTCIRCGTRKMRKVARP